MSLNKKRIQFKVINVVMRHILDVYIKNKFLCFFGF